MEKVNKWKKVKKCIVDQSLPRVLLLVVVLGLIIKYYDNLEESNFFRFIDITLVTALLAAFFFDLLLSKFEKWIERKFEDPFKLTTDYKDLVRKYSKSKLESIGQTKIPIIRLAFRKINDKPFDIVICYDNKANRYELPQQICSKSDLLMEAHRQSYYYNGRMIRLNDFQYDMGTIKLLYSNTTYFDSLVSNRAMDFDLNNGYKSIREIYEPGPFLSELRESKLSNHLGFNGFIETSDGIIILIKRSDTVSIGKRMLATSISASLKVEYAYNEQKTLTLAGISNAIREEIKNELFIDVPNNEAMENSIFAFYRDLIEGGKPQFLFYYKLKDKNYNDVLKDFKPTKSDKKEGKVDGDELIPLFRDKLKECKIEMGSITVPRETKEERYDANPSVAISFEYLIRYFSGEDE